MHLRRTATVALIAACTFAGLGTGPALAEEGDVTWTVRTASNTFGEDRSSYSYSVNPGGTVEDAMIVANRGKDPVELTVYAADGFTTDTGQLDVGTRDKKAVAVGAWLKAGTTALTIPAGRTVEVPFAVTVPANATPGDYVGGLVTSMTQPDQTETINVERRLGIRVKLRVGGDLLPTVAIEDLHVGYAGSLNPFTKGDATVTYTIHNTGNAALSAQQTAEITGPFGTFRARAGTIEQSPELLPGESWKVTVPVPGIAPAFRLTATATLTPVLTDASGSLTSLKPVTATAGTWAGPWALLLLVVLLIAAVIAATIVSRRRRVRRKLAEDARVQEAVEQALQRQA
ncbi:WxL protein peptidoglycan domain-containing protein [Actinoplanes sp. NPDC051494]|uniref:WxL protein peptidoglycan domain-containing protein n=1 Tax=Actinoplanes sp. NPDC051494 TaxID=3363907 RepID=UPI0037A904DE